MTIKPSLPWLYWGLACFQAAHSIEEVAAGLWRWMPVVTTNLHTRLGFVPVLACSRAGFTLANMVIVTILLAFSPFVFLNHTWAWQVAAVVAVLETLNGAGHILAALLTGAYFPGCITGIGLVAAGVSIWGRRFLWKEAK